MLKISFFHLQYKKEFIYLTVRHFSYQAAKSRTSFQVCPTTKCRPSLYDSKPVHNTTQKIYPKIYQIFEHISHCSVMKKVYQHFFRLLRFERISSQLFYESYIFAAEKSTSISNDEKRFYPRLSDVFSCNTEC